MRRTVVLLHEQPGKPDHYDWLIDQPQLHHEHRLITFRTPIRPDMPGEMLAQHAPDHRALYLNYEGPVSKDRGQVTRVLEGTIESIDFDAQELRAVVDWGQTRVSIWGERMSHTENDWRLRVERVNPL
jgi:hypothetical protein